MPCERTSRACTRRPGWSCRERTAASSHCKKGTRGFSLSVRIQLSKCSYWLRNIGESHWRVYPGPSHFERKEGPGHEAIINPTGQRATSNIHSLVSGARLSLGLRLRLLLSLPSDSMHWRSCSTVLRVRVVGSTLPWWCQMPHPTHPPPASVIMFNVRGK